MGPVRPDPGWQAQQHTGYDTLQFVFDWQAKQAICPQGKTSATWTERTEKRSGRPIVAVQFAKATCTQCPVRVQCTRAEQMPRQVTVRPQAEHEALQQARQNQQTEALRQESAYRAGVEGTIFGRCARLRVAPGTLSWLGQNALARTGHCDSAQPGSLVSMASAHTSGENAHVPSRCLGSRRVS